MRTLYLTLAAAGTVLPWIFFAGFLSSGDNSMTAFVQQLFATAPASGFTTDLLVSSTTFWAWSAVESHRNAMTRWWIYPLLTLGVGLSCAFPLFLWAREGALARRVDGAPSLG